MKYFVEVRTSAGGDCFGVYVKDNHDLDRYFHSGQKHRVVGADGKKVSVRYKETPRQRCEAYCKELEAMGYEKEVSQIVKDFREMRALMDDMEYTDEERRGAIDGFINRLPLKK